MNTLSKNVQNKPISVNNTKQGNMTYMDSVH